MLNLVITFFVLAVLAAFLGFGGLAGSFASIAQFLGSSVCGTVCRQLDLQCNYRTTRQYTALKAERIPRKQQGHPTRWPFVLCVKKVQKKLK